MIKCIKGVLWRVAKRLSYIEEARCLKVKVETEVFVLSVEQVTVAVCCRDKDDEALNRHYKYFLLFLERYIVSGITAAIWAHCPSQLLTVPLSITAASGATVHHSR